VETGIATAQKAAEGIIAHDPILGGVAIILAIALLGAILWHVRETGRLNKELLETERQHGKDALQMQSSVTTALSTIQQAISIITAKGGQ
jgi:hypothetical protein